MTNAEMKLKLDALNIKYASEAKSAELAVMLKKAEAKSRRSVTLTGHALVPWENVAETEDLFLHRSVSGRGKISFIETGLWEASQKQYIKYSLKMEGVAQSTFYILAGHIKKLSGLIKQTAGSLPPTVNATFNGGRMTAISL